MDHCASVNRSYACCPSRREQRPSRPTNLDLDLDIDTLMHFVISRPFVGGHAGWFLSTIEEVDESQVFPQRARQLYSLKDKSVQLEQRLVDVIIDGYSSDDDDDDGDDNDMMITKMMI